MEQQFVSQLQTVFIVIPFSVGSSVNTMTVIRNMRCYRSDLLKDDHIHCQYDN